MYQSIQDSTKKDKMKKSMYHYDIKEHTVLRKFKSEEHVFIIQYMNKNTPYLWVYLRTKFLNGEIAMNKRIPQIQ